MTRVVAYVDGFNLYYGLKAGYGRKYHWLDLQLLARSLLRPGQELRAVHYFTARAYGDSAGEGRQATYLDALANHSAKVRLVEGRFQEKPQGCLSCGARWITYEEKETDVNIAVSLVADSAAAASDIALIVSADSDLCPAIRTTRALNPTRGLIAAFPPRRSSFEIRSLVRATFTIAAVDLRNSLLPSTVTDRETGKQHRRPGKWR